MVWDSTPRMPPVIIRCFAEGERLYGVDPSHDAFHDNLLILMEDASGVLTLFGFILLLVPPKEAFISVRALKTTPSA